MRIASLGYNPVNQSTKNKNKQQQSPAFESRARLFPVKEDSGTFLGLVDELVIQLRTITDVLPLKRIVGGKDAQVELSLAAERQAIKPTVDAFVKANENEIAVVLTD